MIDPAYTLQKAVYEALVAQGVCAGAIFSTVPQTQALPFCLIGDDEIEGDLEAGDHHRATVNVTIYAESKSAVKLEFAKVRAALDCDIAIEGFSAYEHNLERAFFTTQPDGLTEQSSSAFSFLLIPSFE